MTNRELVNLFELSSEQEQRDMAHELYKRLFRVVHGEQPVPQQSLFTNK